MAQVFTKEETLASLNRAIANTQADVHELRERLAAREIVLRVLIQTRDEQEKE